ncbi:hypothetical protein ABVK25_008552 [Lepraria finkii]|uniref:AB hydrolase-1 domain-containing protein n=1 Tax=Lepraria finkii TaxID=1340010 RepID=A0ABR4B155_9LECA
MIGTSTSEYLFIQACIYFLHYIAPLSAFYCTIVFALHPWGYRIPIWLEVWAVAETAFLLLLYFPRKVILQRAAFHPEASPRHKRKGLFQLCLHTVKDPEHYLKYWFRGASFSDIKRENVKELFCWAFLNKATWGLEDNDELEDYADQTESLLGRKLEPGRGKAVSLRITIDEVQTMYRSLFWYLCVFVVDSITCVSMRWHSFLFYRLPYRRFFSVFPLRPLTLLCRQQTPAKTLTYWHRPHTSKTRLPVLFIHGIGIGLYPYINFLTQINHDKKTVEDGEIGIIAIEMMPVSFRLTGPALEKDQMCEEILQILQKHGWDKIVLVSHSYGSIISTHLLHNNKLSHLCGPVVLIDPVSILLHLPDVAYNFTCRKPRRANEHQLYYFASMDQGVAHTLGRTFFWSQNCLWKKDVKDHRVTVSLACKDLIVDTEAVGSYLAQNGDSEPVAEEWKHREWKGKGLDILWFDDLDHAQVFDSPRNCEILAKVVRSYSIKEPPTAAYGAIG